MICNDEKSIVVLFNTSKNGIVVHSEDPDYIIGHVYYDFDMTMFVDYDGIIELSNN